MKNNQQTKCVLKWVTHLLFLLGGIAIGCGIMIPKLNEKQKQGNTWKHKYEDLDRQCQELRHDLSEKNKIIESLNYEYSRSQSTLDDIAWQQQFIQQRQRQIEFNQEVQRQREWQQEAQRQRDLMNQKYQ